MYRKSHCLCILCAVGACAWFELQSRQCTDNTDAHVQTARKHPVAKTVQLSDLRGIIWVMATNCRCAPPTVTVTRKTREKLQNLDDPLFPEWIGKWSKWVLAMTPENQQGFRKREPKLGYKITKTALEEAFATTLRDFSCGIYEWKACSTTGEEYVVYIGCTCRSKGGNFIERINEYCTNGSHKSDLIEDALRRGYKLWVRFKGSDTGTASATHKQSAEADENNVLMQYDYAWNIRSVKESVRTLP